MITEANFLLGVDLRHLVALEAVASNRSFARAAKQLGYTQSAVSQQIAALERAVGARLLERPRGRNLVEHGRSGWIYGISTEAGVSRRLELLAELHGERRGSEPTELIVNVGARQKLTRRVILMLAAGKAVRGEAEERPRLLVYAGLQLNVPDQYAFKASR